MAWTATIYRVDDEANAERYGIEPRILGGTAAVWRRLRRLLPGLYCQGWEGWLGAVPWWWSEGWSPGRKVVKRKYLLTYCVSVPLLVCLRVCSAHIIAA